MDERWVYAVVGAFLLFGLWMYAVNTVKIRQMALDKERLRTRVKTLSQLGARQLEGQLAEEGALENVQPSTHPGLFRFLEALEQLRGREEYVFVLDTTGRTWADGSRPHGPRPGPPEGEESAQLTKLLQTGTQGGGCVSYDWKHPKHGDIKPKLSYIMPIGKTPFLVGCGTYA